LGIGAVRIDLEDLVKADDGEYLGDVLVEAAKDYVTALLASLSPNRDQAAQAAAINVRDLAQVNYQPVMAFA
jgi:hypothetical protein